MLRKKYKIALNVIEGIKRYNIVFKRTMPGDFKCDHKCVYFMNCAHWRIYTNNKILHTSDICISYPRTPETIKTRHYYSPHVIKEVLHNS